MGRWNKQLALVLVMALAVSWPALASSDPTMTSGSYSATETELGGIGDFNEGSANYSLKPGTDDGGATLGEATVGNSSSASYQSNSGFNTPEAPGLILVVNSSSIGLGTLSSSAASFGTATFDVTDRTSSGYVVQIVGSTPSNSGHNLTALASDTASSAGTEQFGINTVRNTVAAQGADPVCAVTGFCNSTQVAGDSVTGTYGTTRPYTIPDKYRFNSGETVASSTKSSGDTTFTMTVMSNISNYTRGGVYSGNLSLVATGTF